MTSATQYDAEKHGLTELQRKALRIIYRLKTPSQEEVAIQMGLSIGGVRKHLRALAKKGMLTSDPTRRRSLALTEKGLLAVSRKTRTK